MTTTEPHDETDLSKLEAQLELWSAKFDVALAKARVMGEQAKIDSRRQLDALKFKLEAARSKLDDAKAAGGEKWETLKHGVEQTWEELERTFEKLVR
jgi:hypothetical protein